MDVYCNNLECIFCKLLEKVYLFPYKREYLSIGDTGDFAGKCTVNPVFGRNIDETRTYIYKLAPCLSHIEKLFSGDFEVMCSMVGCMWNEATKCTRDEICVDKDLRTSKWVCRCLSDKKITGHMDWSRFTRQDGMTKF
ncbi:MAG: hypothetical protein Q8P20_08995 [bacterium]|nr:hypothetical protein [bacterium]